MTEYCDIADDSEEDDDEGELPLAPRALADPPGRFSIEQIQMVYQNSNPRDAGLLILDTACAMTVGGY